MNPARDAHAPGKASRETVYTVMPMGSAHAWGVMGKYLARELSRLADVRLISAQWDISSVGDELDFYDLLPLVPPAVEIERLRAEGIVDAPMLQYIAGQEMLPGQPGLRGSLNVGWTAFEENILTPETVNNGKHHFDVVATTSKWCADILRAYGLPHVETVITGVDTAVFRPPPHPGKDLFRDRFVVFSGGKFEYRKGQDLVIRAYKTFQDRHDDVLLVNAWSNPWDFSLATMAASTYISFAPRVRDHVPMMSQVLADNGIDLERVVIMPSRPNVMMARLYQNSDIGLFPNRCEGGTNMVLMEYMACGRPVIASYSSGHKEIVNERNALLVKTMGSLTVSNNGRPIATWDDPSIDEIIEQLEWAYQHRSAIDVLGQQAARDLAQMTWQKAATEFHAILTGSSTTPA